MQGKKQYAEKLFTTFQLSAHVPQDNFYRRLKNLLDLQWLYKGTKEYYGSEGQKSIDPVVFLKLMLIGYLENLGSDRRIIRTVSMRLDMLYFLGYDIDEELPWHSTLSRTRQLYGEELFKQLFKDVLRQCIDKGMVAGRRLESVNREKIRKLRSSTVEPVLGTLVNYLSMRRVNTRGIKQANKCMLMAAVAYNLKKLMKWQEKKTKAAVMQMKKAETSLCFFVFNLWHCVQGYKLLQVNFAFNKC